MKKRIIIFILTVVIILLIPIPIYLKDGGTVEYKAILYKVSKVHRLNINSITGYEEGIIVALFGTEIFNNVSYKEKEEDSNIDFEIVKFNMSNTIKFNNYYESGDRIVYLASNIEEFYIYNGENKQTLNFYLSNTYQTLDDAIQSIANKLTIASTFRDGGTTIYNSKDKDTTIIVCKKINGNKNIYIGDYSLEYESSMCQ